MTDNVRDRYNEMAERYTEVNRGALDHDEFNRGWIARFVEIAALGAGPVADLGCGPGFVTKYLTELGLDARGYDLSSELIATARSLFPEVAFHVGDFTELGLDDASFAGIISRYSLIHADPQSLAETFEEFARLLEPGSPLLLSFFAASSAERHGSPFDHKVVTAYELFPATIAKALQQVGFDRIDIGTHGPPEGARPIDHATILARRSPSGS